MDSLTLTLTWLFYVKYKQRENALRVFPLCFPHGDINYFMSLRNVIKSNNKIYCKGGTGQQ